MEAGRTAARARFLAGRTKFMYATEKSKQTAQTIAR